MQRVEEIALLSPNKFLRIFALSRRELKMNDVYYSCF